MDNCVCKATFTPLNQLTLPFKEGLVMMSSNNEGIPVGDRYKRRLTVTVSTFTHGMALKVIQNKAGFLKNPTSESIH